MNPSPHNTQTEHRGIDRHNPVMTRALHQGTAWSVQLDRSTPPGRSSDVANATTSARGVNVDLDGSRRRGHQLLRPRRPDKSVRRFFIHQPPTSRATQPTSDLERHLAVRKAEPVRRGYTPPTRVDSRHADSEETADSTRSRHRSTASWNSRRSRSPRWVTPRQVPIARAVGQSSRSCYQVLIVLRRKSWPKNPFPSTSSSRNRAALPWGLVLFDACRSE